MPRTTSSLLSCSFALGLSLTPAIALAQAPAPMGAEAPPPDAKALVATPKGAKDAPAIAAPTTDETHANLAAGGLITTGNSKTVALTLNGQFDLRRGNNGFLLGALGNYGESSIKGAPSRATAQNLQGKLRYDRYFLDSLTGFLIATGRHDKFQGLDFRLNLDPGVKYIPYKDDAQALWVELGYDFQLDARSTDGRIPANADGTPIAGAPLLDATRTDHSARGYLGYRRAFNSSVTFSTGVELLQSFVKTDLGSNDTRVNFDANLAAKLDYGFALGVGFTARYDRLPIAGREKLDTTTTLSLIYAWTDAPEKKEEPKPPCPACPACAPPPPPPAAAAPPPAAPAAPEAAPPPAVAAPPPAAPTAPPAPAPTP
jgi:hypothetical protein